VLPIQPAEADLSLYLVSSDRTGADDRTRVVRNFLATAGAIRGKMTTFDDYRFGVRVHYQAPPFEESVRRQMTDLIEGPGLAGPVVSNLQVVEERLWTVQGIPGRAVLYDRPDGRDLLPRRSERDIPVPRRAGRHGLRRPQLAHVSRVGRGRGEVSPAGRPTGNWRAGPPGGRYTLPAGGRRQ
jgi:hypothetical protein